MVEVTIPLARVLSDRAGSIDWRDLSADQVIGRLVELYRFLGEGVSATVAGETATIRADRPDQLDAEGQRLLERGLAEASRGRYGQAIGLLERVLERAPAHVEARRNLGMAHLEAGEVEEAERYLAQALRLDPDDAWSLLLMGNIFLGPRDDAEAAAAFYESAALASPDDPYLLSNLGALAFRQGKIDRAKALYQKAIASEPGHVHGYYNLAVLEEKEGNTAAGIEALELMFARCERGDGRTDDVFEQGRQLYRKLQLDLARSEYESLMALVRERREWLEEIGGVEIELVRDDSLSVSARTEIAWHHRRRSHVVRYKSGNRAVVPHLLAHELEHILLEHEAREAQRNRFFATTQQTAERARSAIASDIHSLKRSMGQQAVDGYIETLLRGFADRLFNMPLDMVIEKRLFEQQPDLRASQFASLEQAFRDGVRGLNDATTKRLTPRLVYNATMAMEAGYALFIDDLWQQRTDYATAYAGTRHQREGKKLFALWREGMASFEPGDEYDLVDQVAGALKVADWYEWLPDRPGPAEEVGGVTNEELLQKKEMASVMYCLGALQRFENMGREEIQQIVGEIALLGSDGIDYASSEKKYTLNSLPGEEFSGLQMLCMMYVGFKDIQPTLEVGVDLSQPYQAALQLYNAE